jgi:hypothetical protein
VKDIFCSMFKRNCCFYLLPAHYYKIIYVNELTMNACFCILKYNQNISQCGKAEMESLTLYDTVIESNNP